jgi:exo-beta-1,3-glucanase (GH17 family)
MKTSSRTNEPLAGITRGLCYSGFREGQHPDRGEGAVNPSYEQTLEDLSIIAAAGFGLIRVYDSGENSHLTLKIIREHGLPLKVLLGIWLKAEISNHETCQWLAEQIPEETLQANRRANADEIRRGIALANSFGDEVIAVNVGNEILVDWNDHGIEPESAMAYVKQVKAAISQPVSVADNVHWWVESGAELADVCDFLAVHSYPVWNGSDIDAGLPVTVGEMEMVMNAYPDKQIVLSEAGWASVAEEFGDRAGEEEQKRYFTELMNWSEQSNTTVMFFEAFDEPWKGAADAPLGAEKHWGLWDVRRRPKLAMRPADA